MAFGGITMTLRSPSPMAVRWHKPLLVHGATLTSDGVAARGSLEIVIAGLSPGRHTLATFHKRLADGEPPVYDVAVGGSPLLRSIGPKRATRLSLRVRPGKRTCKHHDIDPFAYLQDFLRRRPTQPAGQLDELLPDVRVASHPRGAAQISRSRRDWMMKRSGRDDPRVASGLRSFGTTHWSLILAARDRGTLQADCALAALCAAY
jgi:hypothetical protein